ncbi:MAG: HAD hydrolase-like protein [Chloroflexi bacterium]|nr:HAD hydrolase-like protein [Chloroflexota bacterium]
MKHLRLALFDLGDTLVHIPSSRMEWVARAIFCLRNPLIGSRIDSKEMLSNLQVAIQAEWKTRIGENINWVRTEGDEQNYWLEFYTQILKRLGFHTIPQRLLEYLAAMQANPESFVCFPEVHATLQALRAAGIELGIISNAFPSALKILMHHNLLHYFKYTLLSYEPPHGTDGIYAKPNPSIYQHAIDCSKVIAEEILFVDDRPLFVDGAELVGIRSILIDRTNQHPDWNKEKISDLREIVPIFKNLPPSREIVYADEAQCCILWPSCRLNPPQFALNTTVV